MIRTASLWSRLLRRARQPELTALPAGVENPVAETELTSTPSRNLLLVHLESVSWQTVQAFPEAFPHLHTLMGEARTYRRHYASATSTMMVLAALLHGNDMEMDTAPGLAPPSGNAPSLFSLLENAGYATDMLCATPFPERPILETCKQSLPPIWKTNDFTALLERFESRIASVDKGQPFAVQVWSQIPHIEACLSIAPYAESLDDLIAGGCAVADTLLGAMLEILRRKGLLETTSVVVFGDHGDDYYTHGFKNGLLHAVEPYAALVHTPLVIRDPALSAGDDLRVASTIDIAPTCCTLLGIHHEVALPHGGLSLLEAPRRDIVFSQNLTALQPDRTRWDIRKGFAAIDHSHLLLVTCRGLEMYNHRLDPTNQANILHHMELGEDGRLALPPLGKGVHPHFHPVHHMWRSGSLQDSFITLRAALRAHVEAKAAHVTAVTGSTQGLLDMTAFDRINRHGRSAFFNTEDG